MCINPAVLPDGTSFGCRKCWQCKENSIQDWVGRCIAQSKTASHTFAITATYGGGDHERATVLTYSDVQKFFKRLRKAGYKFKYLAAGEYGSRKGRAHWHLVLFFDGKAPPHELRKNFNCPYWGHGHTFWDKPSAKAIRYVCKYVRKDVGDSEVQGHFMMSKKPPIGAEYFAQLAQRYVDHGLSPKDYRYSFAENKDKDGKPVQHYMHGATARDFMLEFLARWSKAHPEKAWPNSEAVEEFVDKLVRYAPDPVLAKRRYGAQPEWVPSKGMEIQFSQPHNRFYIKHQKDNRLWWKPINDIEGEWAWQDDRHGTLHRYEQSDKFRELIQSALQRRYNSGSETLPARGATAYSTEAQAYHEASGR